MLEKVNGIAARLNALTVFRSLLSDPVVSHIKGIFTEKETQRRVEQYALFAAALFEKGGNLSEHILKLTLADENIYMLQCAQKKEISPMLEECVRSELSLLSDISLIAPKELKAATGYDGFLPDYLISKYDFEELYHRQLEDIERHGYGIFAKNRAFLLSGHDIIAVRHPDPITLSALPGYKAERAQVLENTKALLRGRPAANVLLYGDSGTGKSSTVKAVVNEFFNEGLRLIELKKDQLNEIPALLDTLSANPLKFIIFIDDLSFSKQDDNFGALKAALEGSISAKTKNVVVYATSNRRHLVKESFSDREGDDIHLADTIAELTSLSERFGMTVVFERPSKEKYLDIVSRLAAMNRIMLDEAALFAEAEKFALYCGGRSPRAARQFIESLLSKA